LPLPSAGRLWILLAEFTPHTSLVDVVSGVEVVDGVTVVTGVGEGCAAEPPSSVLTVAPPHRAFVRDKGKVCRLADAPVHSFI